MRAMVALAICLCGLLASFGCGGAAKIGSSSSPRAGSPFSGSSSSPAQTLQFGHVVLVVEENHSYSEVIGNTAMPYLNSLASNYGLATRYYANAHPSIGNYFMLTTGQPVTLNDAYTGVVSADNLVRALNASGKTWKAYAESLPQAGYAGGDVHPYVRRHNPFVYFSDVVQQPAQMNNVVPFSAFNSDVSGGHLPNFSFIIPNILDDAHTGSLNQADTWLQTNIAPVLSSAGFQQDGLLIITFDESETSDMSHGGGHVATILVSSKSKKKFQSGTLYQHQSTLRTVLQALGVSQYPGASDTAPAMTEFFQ
ncbi:MAG TPA: alkaline phosphatase family protein [Terriglobales bacterium]|nr:alkaline phosphatase family protein [Terriglobales bacterium]